jgi:hypothetical protein
MKRKWTMRGGEARRRKRIKRINKPKENGGEEEKTIFRKTWRKMRKIIRKVGEE